jgi:hypothetical protein
MNLEGLGLRLFDPDDRGGDATLVLNASAGTFTVVVGDSGVVISSGNGTATITLTGDTVELDNLLSGVSTGTIVFAVGSPQTITFTVTVTDEDGLATTTTFIGNADTFVAPVVVGPAGSLSADQDVGLNIHGASKFSVTDTDDDGSVATMEITATAGTVTVAPGDTGVVVTSGNTTDDVIVEGTITQLNRLLTTVSTGAFSTQYIFDTGIIGNTPTVNTFNFNHATQSSATVARIHDLNAFSVNLAAVWVGAAVGTTIRFEKQSDPTHFWQGKIDSVLDAAGYTRITFNTITTSSANPFVDGDIIVITATSTYTATGTVVFTSPSTGSKTLTVVVTDSDGLSGSDTATIVVASAPLVAVPAAAFLATNTGTPLTLDGIGFVIADDDATGTQSIHIVTTTGTITVSAGNSGVTIAGGNGTADVHVTGTLARINNLLESTGTGTIVFNDAGAASGTITITDTDDTARVGSGAIAVHVAALAQWAGYAAATPTSTPVTIAGFVGLINLFYMPTDWWTNVTADGRDIRVTLDDGTTLLPRDLFSFSKTNKTGYLGVKYTSAVTPPRLKVWVGATQSTAPAVGDTYGQYAVYSASIRAFWHNGTGDDRTANVNHLTAVNPGTCSLTVNGDFTNGGLATIYDRCSYNRCAVAIPTDEPYTMMAAVKPSNVTASCVMSVSRGTTAAHTLKFLSGKVLASTFLSASPLSSSVVPVSAQAVGTVVTGVVSVVTAAFVSDSRRVVFRDAGNLGKETTTKSIIAGATTLYLGSDFGQFTKFGGAISTVILMTATDEAIIAAWNAALYKMHTNNPGFYGGSWVWTTDSQTGL